MDFEIESAINRLKGELERLHISIGARTNGETALYSHRHTESVHSLGISHLVDPENEILLSINLVGLPDSPEIGAAIIWNFPANKNEPGIDFNAPLSSKSLDELILKLPEFGDRLVAAIERGSPL